MTTHILRRVLCGVFYYAISVSSSPACPGASAHVGRAEAESLHSIGIIIRGVVLQRSQPGRLQYARTVYEYTANGHKLRF